MMRFKTEKIALIVSLGLMSGVVYAEVHQKFAPKESHEPVMTATLPTETIDYVDHINGWSKQLTMALVEFETQTLTLNQDPHLYSNQEVMDAYSQIISEIMALTTDLIVNPLEMEAQYETAHELFRDSALAYNQAMVSMWDVATFYQLDVNSDIIDEAFEASIQHLKTGMTRFQEAVLALN